MTSLRVAVIQGETTASADDILDRTSALARDAANGGAKLIAFPETWIPGYPAWLDVCRSWVPAPDDVFRLIVDIAHR